MSHRADTSSRLTMRPRLILALLAALLAAAVTAWQTESGSDDDRQARPPASRAAAATRPGAGSPLPSGIGGGSGPMPAVPAALGPRDRAPVLPAPGASALAAWSGSKAREPGRRGPAAAEPPRADAAAATVPARPMPRESPWALIGFMEDAGVRRAVLTGAKGTWALREGDVLDRQWQVVRLEADAVHLVGIGSQEALRLSWRREGS